MVRIGLQFTFQTHIFSINNIAYAKDTSRIVYIDLHAIAEYYASFKNMMSFEMVWTRFPRIDNFLSGGWNHNFIT